MTHQSMPLIAARILLVPGESDSSRQNGQNQNAQRGKVNAANDQDFADGDREKRDQKGHDSPTCAEGQ